jgi:hypothetical protein
MEARATKGLPMKRILVNDGVLWAGNIPGYATITKLHV